MKQIKLIVPAALAAVAILTLGGCEGIRSSLGLERRTPDETQVVARPPLTLPPDYNLRPPGTATAASADHENGVPGASGQATPGASGLAQKKEESGFFGRILSVFSFDDDTKDQPQQPQAQPAAPPVSTSPDAAAVPPAPNPPAEAPKKEEPGFFGRIFGGIF